MTSGSRASTPTPQDAHVSGLAAQLCTNLALNNLVRIEIWHLLSGLMTIACGLAECNCLPCRLQPGNLLASRAMQLLQEAGLFSEVSCLQPHCNIHTPGTQSRACCQPGHLTLVHPLPGCRAALCCACTCSALDVASARAGPVKLNARIASSKLLPSLFALGSTKAITRF